MYRSCQFRNLCLDTSTQEFLYFPSPEELALQDILDRMGNSDLITVNSIVGPAHQAKKLSLGTIWAPAQENELSQWFPRVVADPAVQSDLLSNGFYQLPDNAVLFPVQPSKHAWSDIFSIYTVLSIFGLDDKVSVLLSIPEVRDDAFPTWLFSGAGLQPTNFGDVRDAGSVARSNLVCAKYGVAGLGMMGSLRNSSGAILSHTIGRGAALYAFRAYMLKNLGVPDRLEVQSGATPPCTITLAYETAVGDDWPRRLRASLESSLSKKNDIVIRSVNVRGLDVKKLAQMATSSTVLISHQVTERILAAATFLPRGAAFVVLDGYGSGTKMRMERDFLEAAGYFRIHWLASPTDHHDLRTLESVVDIVRDSQDRLFRSD